MARPLHWLLLGIGQYRFFTRRFAWLTPARRYRRLSDAEAPLPVADLHLSAGCASFSCRHAAHLFQTALGRAHSPDSWARPFRVRRATTALLDLRGWGDNAGWLAAVKKETDGNMGREVRKARRLGYTTRPIVVNALQGSIAEIRRSKTMRSYGFVPDVLSRAQPEDWEGGASRAPERPPCDKHWEMGWGVFRTEESGEILRAYAIARRVGNLLLLLKFMAHGDVLRDGVSKLLMVDIVEWLYGGADGLAQGVDYVWYGPMEGAAPGLVEWMKDFKFKATLIRLEAPIRLEQNLPPGFSKRRYLKLHPDVAAAGMDARTHWMLFGAEEGRRYR